MTDSLDHFFKVDIRKGLVIDAKDFLEERKPAIKLWIDFCNDIALGIFNTFSRSELSS